MQAPRRLIPARAGKTDSASHGKALICGSSPRGRGKRRNRQIQEHPVRLIPARAGKTSPSAHRSSSSPAHPRAGGENNGRTWIHGRHGGSSPRGRGKLDGLGDHTLDRGLIPARAGKTVPVSISGQRPWAHPRAGGENVLVCALNRLHEGSSPRGRGKPRADDEEGAAVRLIPARAGKTMRRAYRASGVSGSSPRGRGKLSPSTGRPSMPGLIPARAGKTALGRGGSRHPWAHPRAGGENTF